jgi:hypothetical protein
MAVVVKPSYSIQAVAGKHAIIEGRAVILSPLGDKVDDLPEAIYPEGYSPTRVWVALCPPDTFKTPIPHSLYTAQRTVVYNLKDSNIYSDPILEEDYELVNHSQLRLPVIHRYERVALYRGLVGVCGACHQDNPDVLITGSFLTVNNRGLFRKVNKNHPNIVAQTAYYDALGGFLYINVF